MKRYLPVALIGAVLITGCSQESGSQGEDTQGSNRPPSASPQPTEAPIFDEEILPSPEPNEDASLLTFGETYTYEDGVSITVGDPVEFTPVGPYIEPANAYIYVPVTIVNNGSARVDPTLGYASVQSTNVEASYVYETETLGDGPSTDVLPGRETAFRLGFGVADPADIVLEIAPNAADYQTVIFTR